MLVTQRALRQSLVLKLSLIERLLGLGLLDVTEGTRQFGTAACGTREAECVEPNERQALSRVARWQLTRRRGSPRHSQDSTSSNAAAAPGSAPGGPPAWVSQVQHQHHDPKQHQQQQAQHPLTVSRKTVLTKRNCQELWNFVDDFSVEKLTFRALSGVMDRCSKLFLAQRGESQRAPGEEAAACRQLLDAAARELPRLDGWGLCSFIRLSAAVKYLPPAHLASWQACITSRVGELTPQGVSNCLLSLGTLLSDEAPPPAMSAGGDGVPAPISTATAALSSSFLGQQGPRSSLDTSKTEPVQSRTQAAAASPAEQQAEQAGSTIAVVASAAAKMLVSAAARAAAREPLLQAPASPTYPSYPGCSEGGSTSQHALPLALPPSHRCQQQQQQLQQGRMSSLLRDPSVRRLVGVLVARALEIAPGLNPQGLANTTFGIARLGWPLTIDETELLLSKVAATASQFNHLETSQLLQAWAKIEERIKTTRGFTAGRAHTSEAEAVWAGGQQQGDGKVGLLHLKSLLL